MLLSRTKRPAPLRHKAGGWSLAKHESNKFECQPQTEERTRPTVNLELNILLRKPAGAEVERAGNGAFFLRYFDCLLELFLVSLVI